MNWWGDKRKFCTASITVLGVAQPACLRMRSLCLARQNVPNAKLIMCLYIPSLFHMSTSLFSPCTSKCWYFIQSFELGTTTLCYKKDYIPCYITDNNVMPCFTVNNSALYCVLLWTILPCTVLYYEQYWLVLCFTVNNTALYCFTVNNTALYCVLRRSILPYTVLHCEQYSLVLCFPVSNTALYCVLLWSILTCTVFYCEQHCLVVGRVTRSVKRLTTGWTVRDRIPVGTRFSARPDRPWGPPSLL